MEFQKKPTCYSNPIALNQEAHADMTVSPSPNGYWFAAVAQSIILATVEFFDACRQYPIIFTRTVDGRILPLTLLGLEQNENLFVAADGAWLGQYIPAYIRRYPFITTDGADGQTVVCFEEQFDGFNQEGGMPLFENGEPSIKLKEIQAFLHDYNMQMQQTEQFGAMLAQAGLLRPFDLQARLEDGSSYAVNGMLVVDEQLLTQLPDIDIVKLFRSGAMALIHAHLLSLRNVNALIERKVKQ